MSSASMNEQRRVIERWAEYWSAQDLDRLVSLFTDDGVYEDVPMDAAARGPEELRAFVEDVVSRFPAITFELRTSFTNGARGGAEWLMQGIRKLPGSPVMNASVAVRGVSIFEFAGPKIRRCSDYWDMATYRGQLSVDGKVAGADSGTD